MQRLGQVLLVVVDGEHDDARVGAPGEEILAELQAARAPQTHLGEHHVRSEALGDPQSLGGVLGPMFAYLGVTLFDRAVAEVAEATSRLLAGLHVRGQS